MNLFDSFRLGSMFAIVLLTAGWFGGQPAAAAEETRPNILFAIADDWGWPHAGAYGDPVVKTPTFDRLASQGVLFEHAYISSPSCTPSRAAILTGQWHWRLEESANLWSTLKKKFPVYPELLADAGYYVGYTRKGWAPGRIKDGGRTQNPAGKAYKNFKQFINGRPQDKPFCFWFGSSDPHRGYKLGSGKASGMDLSKIRLPACFPDSKAVRGDVADYYWEVQRFDREVGEILTEIKKQGLADNTLVVMTGDHGMPFPRCKGNLYDSGARVPLAIRWAGKVKPGRKVEDFVSLTDLAPTFLEAAGVRPPAQMTGRSLLALLKSPKSGKIEQRNHTIFGKERHVVAQEKPDRGGTPMRAIRNDDFLYIYNFTPDRWPAGTPDWENATIRGVWLGDCDNGPTKTYMVDHREKDAQHRKLYDLSFAKRPAEELYDMKKDPDQLNNIAADPAYTAAKKKLHDQLMSELKASADPRVVGGAEQWEKYPYYGSGPRFPGQKKPKRNK
jgi:N-sulfoglucosamine sulfohydrolase